MGAMATGRGVNFVRTQEGEALSAVGEDVLALEGADRGWPDWLVHGPLGGGGWDLHRQGMWLLAVPSGVVLPAQGWKLHLSATPDSMRRLVRLVVPVLAAHRAAFKVPATEADLWWLNSKRCPRQMAGKCMTVYPPTAGAFARLAAELAEVTSGLVGPEILTDRRVRPGSVVQYRYGAFTASYIIDDDGRRLPVLRAPDGSLHEDRRDPWFAAPPWAPPPFPGAPPFPAAQPATGAAGAAAEVLLEGRFRVHRALRHSAEGGVYAGVEVSTGRQVVIKQARAYIGMERDGRDCRDRRRHEASMFATLAPTGLVAGTAEVFEHADRLFLVCDRVEGRTLRARARDGLPAREGVALARELIALFGAVRAAGVVLVDVSPDNIVIDTAGRLRLIDLDHAALAGARIHPAGTPGFIAPEYLAGGPTAADPAADRYGLGCLLFLLATGAAPVLARDEPVERTARERLARWLAAARTDQPLVDLLAPAILALTAEDPAARRVPAGLFSAIRLARLVTGPTWLPAKTPPALVDRLVDDAVAWLVAEKLPGGPELWRSGRFGATCDRAAVQHGAAGVLGALVAAGPYAAEPARTREAVRAGADWLAATATSPRAGLYFGRAGVATVLYSAGEWLGEERLRVAGTDLAARIDTGRGNPDIAHGTAGTGLAQLRLWWASGDARLRARALTAADTLAASATRVRGALCWPIPAGLRSALAGETYLGYAHGTAGIGDFLLAAGPEYADLAIAAADTLVAAAVLRDGAARWPLGPLGEALGDSSWCTGAAGIGGFLLRAWQAGGDRRYLRLARAAAVTVHRARGSDSTAACHGIPGGGQFLLDMAAALGERRYRAWAGDLAGVLAARAVRRGPYLLVPDESGLGVVADYGVGLAGALAFLARLRHGGLLPWAGAHAADRTQADRTQPWVRQASDPREGGIA